MLSLPKGGFYTYIFQVNWPQQVDISTFSAPLRNPKIATEVLQTLVNTHDFFGERRNNWGFLIRNMTETRPPAVSRQMDHDRPDG